MAFSLLYNPSPVASSFSPSPSISSNYTKTEPKTLTLQRRRHGPSLRLSLRFLVDNNKNYKIRSFRSYVSAQETSPTTDHKGHGDQKDANQSLRALIRDYKEALFNENDKSVAEIEAKIYIIETEKAEMVDKVSTLSAEIVSGKEKLIRLQADFDNFRKRSENDRLKLRSSAQGEVIESLLPMVDSFERARQQIKPETERESKIDTSYQGIYKQFVEILRSLRVAAVATVGKPFDPAVHEALAREESKDFKEGIVIQEVRRGFILGDRLIRPALVKVSAGPGASKSGMATSEAAVSHCFPK